ncbi:ATP-binding cassette domain-containing protein [Enterobacteriaceae endosymbiont of Donacia cincticornis]|uniref:ABC transporter ATP-binding protein n=1 Tax=Enterobacteriaceae endosymbiont of Donacia cincticornis TaxID=2675773 RepID=UPI001449F10C|nr:ABC transporter ATP-binding protein [Enterobacteriaceae endosymbiont of Donacia cincticornis]QJC36126.1 ATP-binding cassette domain-containing protein [Enterobacteriaceae endosymbiont of Donacia cincticornis]
MSYALEIKNLSKNYPNNFKIFENFNLNIKKGDFYALLGPNGAGKTTIINIITSLISKFSGKIKIFGLNITTNTLQVKKIIGLVPQEFNFNPFETVLQILFNQAGYHGLNKKKVVNKILEYLKIIKLWKLRNQKAKNLSGGMKRCLMIIRSLIHNPKLLILDEPTTGIDIESRYNMWNFFKKLNNKKGITIILTTHYLEEAEFLCNHIGIINNGKLIKNCTINNLLNKLKFETFILEYINLNKIFPKIHGYKYTIINSSKLEIIVFQNQNLNNIFIQLTKQNIQVMSLKNKYNKLEKLFIDFISN